MPTNEEPSQFSAFFNKPDQPAQRGKLLSRLFGIFSEELVRLWAADERSPYRDLGRPRIFDAIGDKRWTLDFTFEEQTTGKRFIVEMKCEIELDRYRYMILREPGQLNHHKKRPFDLFRNIARDPLSHRVQIQRQPIEIAGAILIWGDVTGAGRLATISACGFHDIIGMSRIVEDLWQWRPAPFVSFVQSLGDWSNELFGFLVGKEQQMQQVFKDDDRGYVNWRDSHPAGFICNIHKPNARNDRDFNSAPIRLHRASCHTLASNKNGEQPWTTKQYFKICADDSRSIESWILRHAELPNGWQLRRCGICAP